MSDAPRPGEVWAYPYLWAWQERRGETEGRKDRPCAVTIAVRRRDGHLTVVLLAITTEPPGKAQHALPVPETERRRAGLSSDEALWIVLDEYNSDVFETSFYLHPEAKLGAFSGAYLAQIQRAFRAIIAEGDATGVGRNDD